MRLVTGCSLIAYGLMRLLSVPPAQLFIKDGLGIVAGILLLVGLWTPIAGSLVAALGIWNSIAEPGNPWANIFLGTIGIGLALLGPGEWSVDARLFGWKRIDVSRTKNPAAIDANKPESY
jgi:putative oxidoreductase